MWGIRTLVSFIRRSSACMPRPERRTRTRCASNRRVVSFITGFVSVMRTRVSRTGSDSECSRAGCVRDAHECSLARPGTGTKLARTPALPPHVRDLLFRMSSRQEMARDETARARRARTLRWPGPCIARVRSTKRTVVGSPAGEPLEELMRASRRTLVRGRCLPLRSVSRRGTRPVAEPQGIDRLNQARRSSGAKDGSRSRFDQGSWRSRRSSVRTRHHEEPSTRRSTKIDSVTLDCALRSGRHELDAAGLEAKLPLQGSGRSPRASTCS